MPTPLINMSHKATAKQVGTGRRVRSPKPTPVVKSSLVVPPAPVNPKQVTTA